MPVDFEPDKSPLAFEPDAPRPRPKKSMLESGISGTADMLTFGFSDELGAGLRAGVSAPFKDETFGQLYDRYLNEQRFHKAMAEEDNPGSYLAGNVAGAVLPAVATGGASLGARAPLGAVGRGVGRAYKALTPAAGRGIVSNLARGGAAGALIGAGQSNARPTDSYAKAEEFAGDVMSGGALGAGTTGLFGGLGAVGSYVGSKVKPTQIASVMLGIPQEAAELYVKNPAAVNAAKPRTQITQELLGSINDLRDEVVSGSQASRKILSEEGRSISGDSIAQAAKRRADAIRSRAEGVLEADDAATVNWLEDIAQRYGSPVAEEGVDPAVRQFSTNRGKDLVQKIRDQVDFDSGAGKISRLDDRTKKAFSSDIDQMLKSESPAYVEQMKGVAKDAGLLDEVSSLAGSPQAMENLLTRVQRERAYFPAQKIGELDKRLGTNYLQDLKLSQAKDSFDRGAAGPGGSRMVNLYKEMGREFGEKTNVPFAGSIGALTGATIDRYGPTMGKQILDAAASSRKMLNSSDFAQRLGKFAPVLKAAAARGPAAFVTVNQALLKDPEYRRIVAPRMAEESQ
jgi:hypothetical protein